MRSNQFIKIIKKLFSFNRLNYNLNGKNDFSMNTFFSLYLCPLDMFILSEYIIHLQQFNRHARLKVSLVLVIWETLLESVILCYSMFEFEITSSMTYK